MDRTVWHSPHDLNNTIIVPPIQNGIQNSLYQSGEKAFNNTNCKL